MAKMESTLQGFSHAHGVDENGGSSGSKEGMFAGTRRRITPRDDHPGRLQDCTQRDKER